MSGCLELDVLPVSDFTEKMTLAIEAFTDWTYILASENIAFEINGDIII
jgi:hypothetical protein